MGYYNFKITPNKVLMSNKEDFTAEKLGRDHFSKVIRVNTKSKEIQ